MDVMDKDDKFKLQVVNFTPIDFPGLTKVAVDLLLILSYLPKDLNFLNLTSYVGWKESKRTKPIIVDTRLYLLEKHWIVYTSWKQELPNIFMLFSGNESTDFLATEALKHDRGLNSVDTTTSGTPTVAL
ncbi:hypothetical protein PTKIN_Ptkin04bG0096300 [Pterospermum kingtungense]